jgi:aerobic carbon-monoxide dehydrogenase medium subunit
MYQFNYHKPQSIAEARSLYESAEDGLYLAGGHTLIPSMKQRLSAPSDVIDLSGITELSGVSIADGVLRIGAYTTHDTVATAAVVRDHCPAISQLAEGIGDAQVRNRGTIGGSIANNDPAADYPAAILGLDATVHTDQRDIAAGDFFTGMFETTLAEGEVITAVSFPAVIAASYAKFPNPASRYATVGVMVAQTDAGFRVAITGASPCVFRSAAMEEVLNQGASADALDSVDIDPDTLMGDMHASAEYRAQLCRVMAKKAVSGL